MIELRPLLIVFGTLHVEGGSRRDKERRAGDVIAAGYFRRTRELTILHTPWGRLADPANLRKVKDVIAQATIDVARFNGSHSKKFRAENTLVWDHLKFNLRDAVTVWVDRKVQDGNEDVKNSVALLTAQGVAA